MSDASRAEGAEDQGTGLIKTLKRWLQPKTGDAETMRDVIEELIEERIEESPSDGGPVIDANERLLLSNVLNMRAVTAADIMVPRPDIAAVDARTPIPEVLALFMKERHSRLPVYRDSLDDVIGMVHTKDVAALLVQRDAGGPDATLAKIVRKVLFVSPAIRVLDLLLEMRLKRTHMALVVDEYGGLDGLVTIEDVVEQIVGKIEDEHGGDEPVDLRENADGTVSADARVTLAEFEKRFGAIANDEEREATDTLGGLVIRLAGHVPGRGELVKHPSGIEFEVVAGDPRRVRQLRLRGVPKPPLATA